MLLVVFTLIYHHFIKNKYNNDFYNKTPETLSSYITTSNSPFNAPYTGYYWMVASTVTDTSKSAFIRIGLSGDKKYLYQAYSLKDQYQYLSSPLIFIKAGQSMIAQSANNSVHVYDLYCYRV